MIQKNKSLIVVAGPTAVGKTEMAIRLAEHFHTEIISADSRQFYKEMSIGTAKPTKEELARARHHFIDNLSVTDEYSVGKFEVETIALIEEKFKQYDCLILTGGSGLYIKAVCEGMDEMPETDKTIRINLNKEFGEKGLLPLLEKLQLVDNEYYLLVDKDNPQRVIRALEVFLSTGSPYSSFRTGKKTNRNFNIIKTGLHLDREVLYDRINRRVDKMIESGLVEEVESLLPFKHINALQTVGYTEIFDFLDGKTNWEEAVTLLKQNTRRYAKRQLTWFNKDKEIWWFNPDAFDEIVAYTRTKFHV